MKKTMIVVVAFGVIIIVIILIIAVIENRNTAHSNQTQQNTTSDKTLSSENRQMSNSDQSNTPEELNKKGDYILYSKSALTEQTNLIFFAASWCPSCRALDRNINSNLNQIPSNVTILKADYDKEQSLRVKYGVTLQHTIVQVDKDGNELNQWNGLYNLNTLNDVLALI